MNATVCSSEIHVTLNLADFFVPLLYKSFSLMWELITTAVFWWCSTYRWAFTQLFHLLRTNISLSTSTWQQRQQLEVGSYIHKGPRQQCLLSCFSGRTCLDVPNTCGTNSNTDCGADVVTAGPPGWQDDPAARCLSCLFFEVSVLKKFARGNCRMVIIVIMTSGTWLLWHTV